MVVEEGRRVISEKGDLVYRGREIDKHRRVRERTLARRRKGLYRKAEQLGLWIRDLVLGWKFCSALILNLYQLFIGFYRMVESQSEKM